MQSSYETEKSPPTVLANVIHGGKTLWIRDANPDEWYHTLFRWGFFVIGSAITFIFTAAGTSNLFLALVGPSIIAIITYLSHKSISKGKNHIYVTSSSIKFANGTLFYDDVSRLFGNSFASPVPLIASMKNGDMVTVASRNGDSKASNIIEFLAKSRGVERWDLFKGK